MAKSPSPFVHAYYGPKIKPPPKPTPLPKAKPIATTKTYVKPTGKLPPIPGPSNLATTPTKKKTTPAAGAPPGTLDVDKILSQLKGGDTTTTAADPIADTIKQLIQKLVNPDPSTQKTTQQLMDEAKQLIDMAYAPQRDIINQSIA